MEHNNRMSDLVIIIIGRNSSDTRLDEISTIAKIDRVIEVAFMDSAKNPVWANWTQSLGNISIGIGPGAAGCFLAHVAAWKIIEQEKISAALILEDDAQITKYGEKFLHQITKDFLHNDFNIVHLGNDYKIGIRNPFTLAMRHGIRHMLKNHFERLVLRFFRPKYSKNDFPFSTHAYLVKNSMATALSSQLPNFLQPVDVFLNGMSQVKNNKIFRIRNQIFVQVHNKRSSLVNVAGR
jgi:GR25 family glycosyltransferase involved in LPS biosynthesis